MAVGKAAGADDVQRSSGQPEMSDRNMKADTTTASPDAAEDSIKAAFQPDGDVVAMVSRDSSGRPAQSENFVVLVPDDASDEVKAAAWNRAGEAQGSRNLKNGGERAISEHHATWFGMSDEERAKRDKKEAEELRRINRGE